MGLFDKFPYTNFHELNLDWILKMLSELSNKLENFIALNTIKYADPIQWNITTQYEANTVVIDGNTGTAYISTKPVPSGVALTNTDYWTVIFTLDILSANQNITLRNDGANIISTFASNTGDWLLWNSTLYKVIQNIVVSEAYVPGYNITIYTVEDFIHEYINRINDIIGDLDNLVTSDKSSVVGAINETYNKLANLDCFIVPSGDTTGVTDLANIQSTLDSYGSVILGAGDFYINSSIKVKSAQYFAGLGKGRTIIHTLSDYPAFIPYTATQSVDTNTFKDFTLFAPEPTNSTSYAFEFNFTYDGQNYYGPRYCYFENIDVRYFYGGFHGSQMWNTKFNECRFMCSNTCMRLRDAINSVQIISCGFAADKYTQQNGYAGAGIFIDYGNRVECTAITIDGCTFEYCDVGIKLTACRSANLINNYFEKGTNAYVLDGTPQCRIDGAYITGFEILARLECSLASMVFNGLVSISNIHMYVNTSTDKTYIIPTNNVGKVFIHNIGIYNASTGLCYLTQGDSANFRTGNAAAKLHRQVEDISDLSSATTHTVYIDSCGSAEQFKAQRAYIRFNKTFTTSAAATITVTDDNNNTVYTISIPSGTHNVGDKITVNPSQLSILDTPKLVLTASSAIANFDADFIVTGYTGEFKTPSIGLVPTPDFS